MTGAIGIDEDGFVCPNACARHDLAHALGRLFAQKLGGHVSQLCKKNSCDGVELPFLA